MKQCGKSCYSEVIRDCEIVITWDLPIKEEGKYKKLLDATEPHRGKVINVDGEIKKIIVYMRKKKAFKRIKEKIKKTFA